MLKKIEVDYDNPSDLKRVITHLQKRRKTILENLGYREANFAGSKYNFDSLMPVLNSFIDRIPFENGLHYVYLHTNPLKPLSARSSIKDAWLALNFTEIKFRPFYVGKGINNRAYDLNRNDSHRKIRQTIKDAGKEVEPVIIKRLLSEKSALALEASLIDCLGIIALSPQHGYLTNLDEGEQPLFRRYGYSEDMVKLVKANGFKVKV